MTFQSLLSTPTTLAKLRGEQLTEVNKFVEDIPTVQDTKLYIALLAVSNDLQKIVAAAPAYSVSADLEKNITDYAAAVLLSPKLSMYKGNTPVQHVMAILKKHRFDMPAGIEHIPADLAKIIQVIQNACTQKRTQFKKLLFASLRVKQGDIVTDLQPADRQNIFNLTSAFIERTKCCKIYIINDGTLFWDDLDKALATMRTMAKGDDNAVANMFNGLLTVDRNLHGKSDGEMPKTTVEAIQQEVDDLIDAERIDTTTTVDRTGTPSGSGEEEDESVVAA
ncbi:hypothetical protein B0H10DRAFT_2227054 [Mycena sp. CBHHK59/15]|nr:hypothetical protein B0H10DRAFT_2227054 [Mycena sp. CBHHK59/15]